MPRVEDWPAGTTPPPSFDVLLCAFGCEPPPAWRARLAPSTVPAPLWINVDHLSAEPWVDTVHAQVSIKPTNAAIEHYFMPGFTPDSGGLLRESRLPIGDPRSGVHNPKKADFREVFTGADLAREEAEAAEAGMGAMFG